MMFEQMTGILNRLLSCVFVCIHDVVRISQSGDSPLYLAVTKNHVAVVDVLINAGCDVDILAVSIYYHTHTPPSPISPTDSDTINILVAIPMHCRG